MKTFSAFLKEEDPKIKRFGDIPIGTRFTVPDLSDGFKTRKKVTAQHAVIDQSQYRRDKIPFDADTKVRPVIESVNESVSDVRVGRQFLHKRYIVSEPGKPVREWGPETCTITKVAQGMVYFKLDGEKKAMHYDNLETFEAKNVKSWLNVNESVHMKRKPGKLFVGNQKPRLKRCEPCQRWITLVPGSTETKCPRCGTPFAITESFGPDIARRLDQGIQNFVEILMTMGDIDEKTARKVLAYYMKHKLVKQELTSGRISPKHGAYLDKATIQQAATKS